MVNACPACGQQLEMHEGTYVYRWTHGAEQRMSPFANAKWETCSNCGEEFLSGELVSRIEEQRYVNDGLLTPREIKAIRERFGLTQVEMAQRLGVGDKTYARWENGMSLQNKSMDNLIRIADKDPDVFLFIEESRNPAWLYAVEQYIAQLNSVKTQSQFALAAHGEQPTPVSADKIRVKLQAILASRGSEK